MKGMVFLLLSFLLVPSLLQAGTEAYPYGNGSTVIGWVRDHRVRDGESLIELARASGIGYNEIADANPLLDPFVPGTGALVTVPHSWILPDEESYDGIVINLSELRLYYFFRQGASRLVMTFPIGIGSEGNDTPTGEFRVVEKIVQPAWHVPESIKNEKPWLPAVVPPGPDNPLGSHALRLSLGTILIHGTNKPWGVGRRVSHGCIRLYPEDIPKLFQVAPVGVKVTIVRQPVKVGLRNHRVYIEVHDDHQGMNYFQEAVRLLIKKGFLGRIDTGRLYLAAEEKRGIPVDISGESMAPHDGAKDVLSGRRK
jgi:L,D-transpeptidase ErfK/SrfK